MYKTSVQSPHLPPLPPQPDADSNKIPELERPARPTVNEVDLVKNSNEIPLLGNEAELEPSNVLMSHHASSNIFDKTEVLAGQYAARRRHFVFKLTIRCTSF